MSHTGRKEHFTVRCNCAAHCCLTTRKGCRLATKTVITCDMHADGVTSAQQTIRFAVDGKEYELDLCAVHAAEFGEVMQRFVEAGAREVSGNGGGGRRNGSRPASRGAGAARRRSGGGGDDTAAIREWARANGFSVSSRGRIPREVLDAYGAQSGAKRKGR